MQTTIAVLLVVSGYMLYLGIGPFFALPADLLGNSAAGTGIGLMNAFAYAGAAVGTSAGGWLIKQFGYNAGFWFMSGCALAGAVLIKFVKEGSKNST